MVLRPGPDCGEAAGRKTALVPSLAALFYSHEPQGAAVSPFNLGQTDGDSVCGDCINISNSDEGCFFFLFFSFFFFGATAAVVSPPREAV